MGFGAAHCDDAAAWHDSAGLPLEAAQLIRTAKSGHRHFVIQPRGSEVIPYLQALR
ncbi:MAG TPA: hypothetical protein VFK82_05865 [Burkholderiaceae bacterium]|nr:hypothetical protein [Burkholderiaceae bacterium]